MASAATRHLQSATKNAVTVSANHREIPAGIGEATAITALAAISFSHLLNDMIQSLIPAIYPLLKDSFHLDFTQIGLITLAFQLTASLLQPVVGHLHRSPAACPIR